MYQPTPPFSLVIAGVVALSACRSGCSSEVDEGRGTAPRRVKSAGKKAGGSAGPVPEAVALCTALHVEPGRRRAECCRSAGATLVYDECVRHLSLALETGSVGVDSDAIERCERATKRQVTGCDWVVPTLLPPPAECRGIVVGLVAEGGRCRSSLECESALHCEGQGASSPGVCRKPQPVSASCGVGVDPLATYLSDRDLEARKPSCADHCSLVTHRCQARPEPGTPCRASVNCARDQICHESRCETRAAGTEGESCDGASCAPGHRCIDARCTARALSGETCRSDLDCAIGGCVVSEHGQKACGMKCASALGSLATPSEQQALPRSSRGASTRR